MFRRQDGLLLHNRVCGDFHDRLATALDVGVGTGSLVGAVVFGFYRRL